MKICLVFPRTTWFDDPMVYPPLGLWYLWSQLERDGHSVEFFDLSEYKIGSRGEMIFLRDNPPLQGFDVWFVSGTSPQASEIRRIGKLLEENDCPAIVGGPHVTNYSVGEEIDQNLVSSYPILVRFEGEEIITKALEILEREEGIKSLRQKGRGIVLGPSFIKDLGAFPPPARYAAHKYRYFIEDEVGRAHRTTTIFTARGCPFNCAFCDSRTLWGEKVRYEPLSKVKEDIGQIKNFGFTGIQFYDDTFPLNKRRTLEICDLLRKQGFIWRCALRVDIISKKGGKDYLQSMYDSGLREVLVGVESGSQRILHGINKETTVEQNTLVRKWCKEVGIRFKASIVLGLPGESKETLKETERWLFNNRPDKLNICALIPLAGTPIVKHKERYDVNWDTKLSLDEFIFSGPRDKVPILVSTSHLTSEEIGEFRARLIEEFKDIPY